MGYSLNWQLNDHVNFDIECETLDELLTQYEKAGGNPRKLLPQIRQAVKDGEAEGTTRARVADATPEKPAPKADDPWGDDEPAQEPPEDDPWADESEPSRPAQRRTEAASPSTTTDRFGRVWTLGLPEAPNCHCGIPAARLKAKSKSSGNKYTVWKCAKAQGQDWRDKCDFSEFPD